MNYFRKILEIKYVHIIFFAVLTFLPSFLMSILILYKRDFKYWPYYLQEPLVLFLVGGLIGLFSYKLKDKKIFWVLFLFIFLVLYIFYLKYTINLYNFLSDLTPFYMRDI